jgi:hypothetical protein
MQLLFSSLRDNFQVAFIITTVPNGQLQRYKGFQTESHHVNMNIFNRGLVRNIFHAAIFIVIFYRTLAY